jgi:chemotaxis family two-component system response regulator Rcp1
MMVEDNRGDVILVREALKESTLEFELNHVPDGEQAIGLIRELSEHDEDGRPDLVLLDINLPKRDGWEVLDEIRSQPQLRRLPVIILSSSASPEDLRRAQRAKASLYIRKPSNLDDFLAIGKQIESFWSTANPE